MRAKARVGPSVEFVGRFDQVLITEPLDTSSKTIVRPRGTARALSTVLYGLGAAYDATVAREGQGYSLPKPVIGGLATSSGRWRWLRCRSGGLR